MHVSHYFCYVFEIIILFDYIFIILVIRERNNIDEFYFVSFFHLLKFIRYYNVDYFCLFSLKRILLIFDDTNIGNATVISCHVCTS